MKFYTRFNKPPKVVQTFKEPSLTVQGERDNTDVHNILNRFVRTGDLGYFGLGKPAQPFYGDFSETPDFQQSMELNARASEYFDQLPSKIRKQFDNDFRKMINFIGNDANHEVALEMGLLERLPEVVKDTVQNVVNTLPTESNESNDTAITQ